MHVNVELWVYPAILLVAFIYASIGHGGATGYLAILTLAGSAMLSMRTSALILNILVSGLAFYQFHRLGYLKHNLFLILVAGSVPFAFLGGLTPISDGTYKIILGLLLLVPILKFSGVFNPIASEFKQKPVSTLTAILMGCTIGYFSGLTGIGGGVLLSPILLILQWTNMKQTAVISAGFIFLNSIAGLSGLAFHGFKLDNQIISYILLALTGGILGAYFGANKFNVLTLSRILAVVLGMASLKLILFA